VFRRFLYLLNSGDEAGEVTRWVLAKNPTSHRIAREERTVGFLYYGSESMPAEIPDRILAHVKLVATTKLRRGESFTMTWRHATGAPEGRTSIWMQPSIPLRFVFDEPEPERLDPELLHSLANAANSANGLIIDLREVPDQLVAAARQPAAAAA
jgi:hypothetical protein